MDKRPHGRLPKPIEIKLPPRQWWVCCMHGGGHFMISGSKRPAGKLIGEHHTIAADSYDVVYGPCSYAEGEAYMDDMENEES